MDYIFNPERDIQAVSQVCLPTLGQIMESGIMPQVRSLLKQVMKAEQAQKP